MTIYPPSHQGSTQKVDLRLPPVRSIAAVVPEPMETVRYYIPVFQYYSIKQHYFGTPMLSKEKALESIMSNSNIAGASVVEIDVPFNLTPRKE